MHEGCNARALVQIDPEADGPITPSALTFRLAGQNDPITLPAAADTLAIGWSCARRIRRWGCTAGATANCVLPKGAVSANLVGRPPEEPPALKAGDFLIFEIVASADLILKAEADPPKPACRATDRGQTDLGRIVPRGRCFR